MTRTTARATAVLATLGAALATPTAAQAAELVVGGQCFATSQRIPITGTGFTPGAFVVLRGDVSSSATADQNGSFIVNPLAPFVSGPVPKEMKVEATESGAPAPSAAATFPVIRDLFFVDAKLSGKPSSKVRWRFAGFRPGEPVYGHFRFKGRTIRNYRFGTAQGPCGTLTARARRLPVGKLRYGTWKLKFDSSRSYSAKTPGRLGSLTVFRTFRRR